MKRSLPEDDQEPEIVDVLKPTLVQLSRQLSNVANEPVSISKLESAKPEKQAQASSKSLAADTKG